MGIEVLQTSITNLIILVGLFARIIPLFSQWHSTQLQVIHARASMNTILDLQQESQRHQEMQHGDSITELTEDIVFDAVSFSYQNSDTPILEHANFTIPKRQTTLIRGDSGAGKSTLVKLLTGLLMPTEGHILINGHATSKINLKSWRNQIGLVEQDSFLVNDTVINNLVLGDPNVEMNEINEAIRLAAAEFALSLPQGLQTNIGDAGCMLSSGQKQRLTLARALLRKPGILILDEPTGFLDESNKNRIYQTLGQLKGIVTIVVISHTPLPDHLVDQELTLMNQDVLTCSQQ
jgi:ATP-binding cassette subfamily C protein